MEHRISELEDRNCEITQFQENKESQHDLCDFIQRTSMRITGIPEEEGGRQNINSRECPKLGERAN